MHAPTASQIMAAKKAAKHKASVKRTARDNIGNQRIDRNVLHSIKRVQMQNRQKMQSGVKQTPDAQLTENIRNLMHYEVLVYRYDRISVTVFEKLIRAMRVLSAVYWDQELTAATNAAQAAIERLAEDDADGLSPNQRREILKPLLKLIRYCGAYDKIVPRATVDKVGLYCASVQVALYTANLYNRPKRYVQALFDIINGASLRETAKKTGEKENILREEVLNAAWLFYRIAECFIDIEPADTIPQLRGKEYVALGDFDRLGGFVRRSMEKVLVPFEQHTGISLIDYDKFKQDLIRAETV
ncbi:hypothetical protein [Neisseria polysaccharea]|uniref:hypothetical protein n=1 Tax=Neisseria polysaccharea TaxID=489 RepID=UPI0027DF23E7|nr:hypothetical protein [Neisseria polysaccharea]